MMRTMTLKFVADVSNVINTAGASSPDAVSLARYNALIEGLNEKFGEATVISGVIDASTVSMLVYRRHPDAAELRAMLRDRVISQAPAKADPILLEMARSSGYVVVSNDHYREYDTTNVLRLPFAIVDGRAYFDPADVRRVRDDHDVEPQPTPLVAPADVAFAEAPVVLPGPTVRESRSPEVSRDQSVAALVEHIGRLIDAHEEAMSMKTLADLLAADKGVAKLVQRAIPARDRDWLHTFVDARPAAFVTFTTLLGASVRRNTWRTRRPPVRRRIVPAGRLAMELVRLIAADGGWSYLSTLGQMLSTDPELRGLLDAEIPRRPAGWLRGFLAARGQLFEMLGDSIGAGPVFVRVRGANVSRELPPARRTG